MLILERAWLCSRLRALPVWPSRGYALLAVMTGWVWFRADGVPHAIRYFGALLGVNGMWAMTAATHLSLHATTLLALWAGTLLALRSARARWLPPALPRIAASRYRAVVAVADTTLVFALLALSLMAVGAGSYSPFLYFRF